MGLRKREIYQHLDMEMYWENKIKYQIDSIRVGLRHNHTTNVAAIFRLMIEIGMWSFNDIVTSVAAKLTLTHAYLMQQKHGVELRIHALIEDKL